MSDRVDLIELIVIDVDGTMTDGGIYYDESGNELKKFCTKDAAGFFTAHQVGIKIMVLTGRESQATTRRMTEMKVEYLCQNVWDKYTFLKDFMYKNQLKKEQVAYIGDDLNDLYPMTLAGYSASPSDACEEVKKSVDYISTVNGGYGAVRDIICHILKLRGEWDGAYKKVYNIERV